jgi:hypothetical protein
MIWVGWRQFRNQAIAGAIGLAIVAVVLAITGAHLAHLYSLYRGDRATCSAALCSAARSKVLDSYHHVRLLGTVLIALPGIIGVFWGAPLVTREIESGTHRLAWTQGVTQQRWLLTKLAIIGLASALAAGLYSLAMTWWALPFDHLNANRISPAIFDQRGIVPVGYAVFAFALGVAAGVIIRRTLPAMAATLVGFVGVRMLIQYLVRPHLLSPLHATRALTPSTDIGLSVNSSGPTIVSGHPSIHGSWVLGSSVVDSSGHAPSSDFVRQACSAALAQGSRSGPLPPGNGGSRPAPHGAPQAFTTCIHNVSTQFYQLVTYQPGSRFWAFQGIETGVFIVLAIGLAALSVWWLRRRRA